MRDIINALQEIDELRDEMKAINKKVELLLKWKEFSDKRATMALELMSGELIDTNKGRV